MEWWWSEVLNNTMSMKGNGGKVGRWTEVGRMVVYVQCVLDFHLPITELMRKSLQVEPLGGPQTARTIPNYKMTYVCVKLLQTSESECGFEIKSIYFKHPLS